MIVTLTANPSIDRTVQLDAPLRRAEVQRCSAATSVAGGKGVNVARAIHAAGRDVIALLPAREGDPMRTLLDERALPYHAVPVPFAVRTNLTIAEADGTTTKINEPGHALSPADAESLVDALLAQCQDAAWVALCGSLPQGAPAGWYGEVIGRLRERGKRVALDTSGAPLTETVAGDHLPSLLKPNSDELAELTGEAPETLEDNLDLVVAAGRTLVARGIEYVLVTLGSKGAVLVTADGQWQAEHAPVSPVSTVGAGDSTLSGFLLGVSANQSLADALALAVAYGSAAVRLPGSQVPNPEHLTLEAVTVRSL
ncbi:1-phosphofructokinase [Micrococcales bacterium 31B]|nr:1-phosphofructokinase [Micrococcales bacterium 31B]